MDRIEPFSDSWCLCCPGLLFLVWAVLSLCILPWLVSPPLLPLSLTFAKCIWGSPSNTIFQNRFVLDASLGGRYTWILPKEKHNLKVSFFKSGNLSVVSLSRKMETFGFILASLFAFLFLCKWALTLSWSDHIFFVFLPNGWKGIQDHHYLPSLAPPLSKIIHLKTCYKSHPYSLFVSISVSCMRQQLFTSSFLLTAPCWTDRKFILTWWLVILHWILFCKEFFVNNCTNVKSSLGKIILIQS